MNNLQGLIRRGIVNTEVQFEKLGYVSSNVANINTNGYKSVRFEQMLNEEGYLDGTLRVDHAVGSMYRTERPFDVGVDGPGFIPVTSPDGIISYTRDGSFKVGKEGYLLTADGHMVGEGIKMPLNSHKVLIEPDGRVTDVYNGGDTGVVIGKIPLVYFPNPEGLEQYGENKFIATEESGEPVLYKDHTSFRQGFLEKSNTNLYTNVSDVLRLNASMLAGFKLMKTIDDMYSKAINLRQ